MSERYPSTLNHRYSLLAVIGSGGMGVVWRAFDRSLRRHVACKVFSDSDIQDPANAKRFQREALHIASLSHPNIVMVYDSGTDGGFSYIVMECVDGASLRQLLGTPDPLPTGAAVSIAVQVLAGLAHAHDRGIVHRDIKPANLLIQSNGTVKVADFGIAKSLGDITELTVAGGFIGTSTYASPEQLAGSDIGPQADLYSFGCVLFQCLSGRPPFRADGEGRHVVQHRFADPPSLSEERSDVPEGLSLVVRRAMAKDPADRFTSAQEMREAILPFVDEAEWERWLTQSRKYPSVEDTEATESQETPHLPVGRSGVTTFAHGFPGHEGLKARPSRRVMLILAALLLLAVGSVALLSGGGSGNGTAKASSLRSGHFLQPGQSLESPNQKYAVVMQRDGNLVDYSRSNKLVLWESNTSGNFGAYVVMQSDGDLVLYPHGKAAPAPGLPTSALWSSGTYGHPGATAAVLSDGHFVVRARGSGTTLWTATNQ